MPPVQYHPATGARELHTGLLGIARWRPGSWQADLPVHSWNPGLTRFGYPQRLLNQR